MLQLSRNYFVPCRTSNFQIQSVLTWLLSLQIKNGDSAVSIVSIITDVQQVNTIIAFVEIFSHLIPLQTSKHDARCATSSLSYIMAARRVLHPRPMELAWFSQCLLDIHQRQASEFSGAAYAAHTARAAPLWAQPIRAALSDERAGVSQRDRRRQTAPYRNAIGATHHFINPRILIR